MFDRRATAIAVAFVVSFVSSLLASSAASATPISAYTTTSPQELTAYLASEPRVVYSQRVTGIKPGEQLHAFSQMQVTNMADNYPPVEFLSRVRTWMIIAPRPTDTSGTTISGVVSDDISSTDMHHKTETLSGAVAVEDDTPVMYVNVIAAGEPVNDTGLPVAVPGPATRVDRSLGHLTVSRLAADESERRQTAFAAAPTAAVRPLRTTGDVVHTVDVGPLEQGDVVEVFSRTQLSQISPSNTSAAFTVVLADRPADTTSTDRGPTAFTATRRNAPLTSAGAVATVRASRSYDRAHVNIIARAQRSAAIDSGAGEITAVVHRAYPAEPMTPAPSPPRPFVQHVEAERFSDLAAGSVVDTVDRANGQALSAVELRSDQQIATDITLTRQATQLAVRVRPDVCALTPGYAPANHAEGSPVFTVTVDGERVAETSVYSSAVPDVATDGTAVLRGRWTENLIPVSVPAGTHRVTVQLTNPASSPLGNCRRAVQIDRLSFSDPAEGLPATVNTAATITDRQLTSDLPLRRMPTGAVSEQVVFSAPLTSLAPGDILRVQAHQETANAVSATAPIVAGRIVIADSPAAITGIPVTRYSAAGNLPASAGRLTLITAGQIRADKVIASDAQPKWVNLIMYAAEDAPVADTASLRLRAGAGQMSYVTHRAGPAPAADDTTGAAEEDLPFPQDPGQLTGCVPSVTVAPSGGKPTRRQDVRVRPRARPEAPGRWQLTVISPPRARTSARFNGRPVPVRGRHVTVRPGARRHSTLRVSVRRRNGRRLAVRFAVVHSCP
jgi:hypothetical protein